MTNINPLRFGVTGNQYYKPVNDDESSKNKAQEQKTGESKERQIASNEVLGFLAAQNVDLIPVKTQKTLDVSKYVTPEQEARIAGFMKGFEENYDAAFATALNEFPEISDGAAQDLALAYINSSY